MDNQTEMSEVRRWNVSHRDMEDGCVLGERFDPKGKYVLYVDHAAALTALTEQVRVLTASEANYKWEFERQQERADKAEAEVARVTAENITLHTFAATWHQTWLVFSTGKFDVDAWAAEYRRVFELAAENTALKAQIAAYEMPVSDIRRDALEMAAAWLQHNKMEDAALKVMLIRPGTITDADRAWADSVISRKLTPPPTQDATTGIIPQETQ